MSLLSEGLSVVVLGGFGRVLHWPLPFTGARGSHFSFLSLLTTTPRRVSHEPNSKHKVKTIMSSQHAKVALAKKNELEATIRSLSLTIADPEMKRKLDEAYKLLEVFTAKSRDGPSKFVKDELTLILQASEAFGFIRILTFGTGYDDLGVNHIGSTMGSPPFI